MIRTNYAFSFGIAKQDEIVKSILSNFRTGAQVVLPTASVVSAAFKRERRVLVQMVVLVLVYVICWMPFWILYTWFWACNHIHWMHMTSKQWQSGDRVIIQTIYGFDDIIYIVISSILHAPYLIINISF